MLPVFVLILIADLNLFLHIYFDMLYHLHLSEWVGWYASIIMDPLVRIVSVKRENCGHYCETKD